MKSQTLKENKDFRRLYYRGKSVSSPCLVTYALKARGGVRYGITTSKKTGNAVERNRSRRVIRVALSELEEQISGSWDIVFVARSKTHCVKMQRVRAEMAEHFKKLGIIDESN